QELLSDGRGRLFPFGDHAALSDTLIDLLGSPRELRRVRDAALAFAGPMAWPRIGDRYVDVIRDALQTPAQPHSVATAREAAVASALPELCLDHLRRLTDDTGIIQHATYNVPARRSGYCVDDNARALIVAVQADRVQGSADTRGLVTTYLSYLLGSQTDDGS